MNRTAGVALISVLSIVLTMSVLLSSLVLSCRIVWNIRDRERTFEHCAAYATGVARTMLQALQEGNVLQSSQTSQFDQAQVKISAANHSGLTLVKVEVEIGDVSDTIGFTYDTIAHRLRAWQDNGPGIAE
ncbi:hypothetical protein NZD89_13330 [Alicyclobacillus fastidiosus]|uniref:Uncharacterized protein n=1 Tax=Alicyclobacillus fastidiosus TaxID=392011 RepID=A0ABY6ZN69_9BACL|nr:hypothetical protein [Alicyclobacillus fastidiosus]WAH44275.1 hypothetical protein NZD89_13330 [Alicyclobacillus fastidiosus]GMA60596.1 hypothetical protein GCM10025859_10360 [Alicyclobacillus fastidiosus]